MEKDRNRKLNDFIGLICLAPLDPLINTGPDWDRLLTTDLLKSLAIDGEGTCGNTSLTCCTICMSLVLGLALSWMEDVLPFGTELVSWNWTLACATKKDYMYAIVNINKHSNFVSYSAFSKIIFIGKKVNWTSVKWPVNRGWLLQSSFKELESDLIKIPIYSQIQTRFEVTRNHMKTVILDCV